MTRSRNRLSRRFAMAATSALTGLVLCSCGTGTDEPTGPETSTPASPVASESQTAPTSPGGTAEINGAQLTAPDGWTVKPGDVAYVIRAPKDANGDSPGSGVFNSDVTLTADTEDLAAKALTVLKGSQPNAKRLPDVTYGGVTIYHLRGGDETNSYDEYGAVVGESQASVAWTFINDFATRKQIDELINQVMPTFKFEG